MEHRSALRKPHPQHKKTFTRSLASTARARNSTPSQGRRLGCAVHAQPRRNTSQTCSNLASIVPPESPAGAAEVGPSFVGGLGTFREVGSVSMSAADSSKYAPLATSFAFGIQGGRSSRLTSATQSRPSNLPQRACGW